MSRKTIVAAVVALALAAAGVATAAAVTHQSTRSGTVTLHKTSLGKVLATKSGLTLYLFMADKQKGKSACYGQCASFWPPLLSAHKPTAGTGVKAALLGTIKRKNGTKQVTYKGHPLYRYKGDKGAGQTKGEGQDFFGGKWWGVNSAGRAVKGAPGGGGGTTTTSPYTTTTSPYPGP
jgi:predicted lipoprotein with Yx(FWY)xxD motif